MATTSFRTRWAAYPAWRSPMERDYTRADHTQRYYSSSAHRGPASRACQSGILARIAKNVPESIVRAAAQEVAREAARKGGKAGIKSLARAVLRRMPAVVIIFAAADYVEGGWEKAAKNAVIPGDLIEAVAAQAGDIYDQWFAHQAARLNQRRFGMIKGWLPEVP